MIDRKTKANLGRKYADSSIAQAVPALAAARTGISLIELMLYEILRGEFEALRTDADKRTRYLKHLFDPVAGAATREMMIKQLELRPPTVVQGYPRQGAEMPCLALILEEETEDLTVLADYVGETLEGERGDFAEYVGASFMHTFALWVYAEHPIVCAGLYQVTKMILVGARRTLAAGGLNSPTFSGGELAPNPEYIPENIYVRTMRIKGSSVFTVPEYVSDPANFRIGVFADDVIVDGVRGGVQTFTPATPSEDD